METNFQGPVVYDSPAMVGLVGDRPIEPMATDYAAAVDSAAVPSSASTVEQSRWPSVQRHASSGGQLPETRGPRVLTTAAVQRNVGAGTQPAATWPPDALAEPRTAEPRTSVNQPVAPVQFTQFVAAAPAVMHNPLQPDTELVDHPPQWSTEPAVQRAADEPAATTAPATATGPPSATGAATPAQPAGSTSPTEIDKLVRRLYDPIVRRLKAELQLDRERAGRSLDLWH